MSTLSQFGSGGIKSIQRIANNATWVGGSVTTTGTVLYFDVPIGQVVASKSIIVPNREIFQGADNNLHPIKYFIHAAGNMVRCLAMQNATQPGFYAFEVLEFR